MASVQDIYDEITRIDNAKQGIAEAIEEKGVQVPEESRIGEYPGLVRQIQTGSPDAVLYTPQELTPEQQEQARENIGAGTYTKPGTGIPKTDLSEGVQTSLGKADTALQQAALNPITELIPEQATPQNQLADKNFVNSSVATNTANYISDNGQPFQSVEDLEAYTGTLTNNDYAFVVGTDSAGNTTYTRYKYNANTQTWAAEYVLNNSSFTAAQWAAISSGITALLVQKLSELPTEVVTYVSQTLTEAQKQQARSNIGATAPEVFWAEYGVTTYAEIVAATTAGKACFAIKSGNTKLYPLGDLQSGSARFYIQQGQYNYELRCNSDDTWQNASTASLRSADKVDTIVGNETATNKIPSTKAVADALGKMGVVSQTQTWTGSAATGYDYTMSNIVRGLIPQEFIDRAVSHIGVSFNEQTGYFELNGLADISYQEMLNIVEFFPVSVGYIAGTPAAGGVLRTRTTIPLSNTGTISLGYAFFSLGSIEVINFQPSPNTNRQTCNNINNIARGSIHLRVITGLSLTVSTAANADRAFENCYSLETAKLAAVRISLSFAQSSRLSLESVVYIVDNAYANSTFTLTLHATAYARCQADTTEYTYNGQTYTGVIAYAAAKNITIQSA